MVKNGAVLSISLYSNLGRPNLTISDKTGDFGSTCSTKIEPKFIRLLIALCSTMPDRTAKPFLIKSVMQVRSMTKCRRVAPVGQPRSRAMSTAGPSRHLELQATIFASVRQISALNFGFLCGRRPICRMKILTQLSCMTYYIMSGLKAIGDIRVQNSRFRKFGSVLTS